MKAQFHPGNKLRLLDSGHEYFPALLAAIEAAQREIYLESYIFAADRIGEAVCAALCAAAQRGVTVNVTVDGFGARNFAADFQERLAAAGVRALVFRPELGRFRLKRHRLRRLHRKLAVIDGHLAFVGGINIVDDDNAPPAMRPRYDYAVQIQGPVLVDIHRAARRLWEIVTWVSLRQRFRFAALRYPCCDVAGTQEAAFLVRDNLLNRNSILNAYIAAIHGAREDILIANAYFLPGLRFGRALYAAAQRGVKVTVLLQGKTDHPLLRYATQALYGAALKAGIHIFEYEKSFMHAKVAVIDMDWATVGSSNIDPFSLLLAKEANIVVRDAAFAGALRAHLMAAIAAGARAMCAQDMARQVWPKRFLRWLSYGLVRLLVGIAGYGERHWQAEDQINQDAPPR
ncbi:cardiolipin synthase ClsB [Azonexus sp.]|uniref:cardiolipin synthase ClsB n=1 Tax=Azonexus sp. TaxID=1872668 RepID=UPI0039E69077